MLVRRRGRNGDRGDEFGEEFLFRRSVAGEPVQKLSRFVVVRGFQMRTGYFMVILQ